MTLISQTNSTSTEEKLILYVYSLYLSTTAMVFVYQVYQQVNDFPKQEVIICLMLALLITINGLWHVQGVESREFAVASMIGRSLAALLFLFLPTITTTTTTIDERATFNVPYFSQSFGIIEVIFLLLQLRAYLNRSSTNINQPQRRSDWARVLFGVYLVAFGFFLLLSERRWEVLAFFGITETTQRTKFIVVDNDSTSAAAGDLSFLLLRRFMSSHVGVTPLYLATCFTRLLGLYNIVAGYYRIDALIRAGREGGAMFTVLVVGAVVLFGASPRLLLLPAIDIVSIIASLYFFSSNTNNRHVKTD